MDQPIKNHGVRVTLAGLGINLALGILYTWSVIKAGIPKDWEWSDFEKTLPYSTAVLVFSLMMVPAGRLQDRLGPRLVATLGGLMVGLGMILASMADSSTFCHSPNGSARTSCSGVKPTVIIYFIGFRSIGRHGHWLRVCLGDAAGRQVVSARAHRDDRRTGGVGLRSGLGLRLAAGHVLDRRVRAAKRGVDSGRRVPGGCGGVGTTAGCAAEGLCSRRQ